MLSWNWFRPCTDYQSEEIMRW